MATDERHDPFAAIRSRDYRWFAAGWLPASLALQMQGTALAWEVYERTDNPLSIGLACVARALPTVLLALPAGQIVDRINRRRVLTFTQVGFTIAALLLTLGSFGWEHGWFGEGSLGLWIMLGLISLTGCARVFNGPSRASLLPSLVPGGATGAAFHNAVTWNSGMFQIAAIVGPIAAGSIIWLLDAIWPVYLCTALGCLWFACTSVFIRVSGGDASIRTWRDVLRLAAPSNILPGMLEGARHIRRERVVLGAITLDLFAVLLGGATALFPVYAKDVLHVGEVGHGALRSAANVGALLTAIYLAHRRPFQKAGPALLWSIAGFGVTTIIFGLSTSFWLSLAMLAIGGGLDGVSVVVRHVLVSARTPDHLRGRVSAVNSVFIESSNELGGLESTVVSHHFGEVASVVSGGAGTVAVVIGTALCLPELRRLGRLDVSDAAAAEEAGSDAIASVR